MATIPTVPDEKDTTKVSLTQAIINSLGELNSETGATSQLGNGSFEDIESGEPLLWVVTDNAGGSHAISDATESGGEAHHGQRSLQCVTTGGGGYVEALSDIFLPVGEDNVIRAQGFARRDTSGIRKRIQVLYYDEDLSLVSTDTMYDNSGTDLTYERVGGSSDVPATAHYYKIKLIAGESGGAIAGNVFFDGFIASILMRPPELEPVVYTSAGAGSYTVPSGVFAIHITCAGAGGGGGGGSTRGGGGGSGYIEGHMVGVTPGDVLVVTVGAGGVGGGNTINGTDGGDSWVGVVDFDNRYVAGDGGGGGVANGGAGGVGWNDGGSPLGEGGDHVYGTPGVGGAGGTDATGNCAGGGGSSGAGNFGGDGADGYVVITPHLT